MKPEIDTVLVLNEVGQQVPMKLLKPLYTADQLRAAKVAVLREAAERVNAADGHSTYLVQGQLRRMADELEKAK